MPTATRSSRWPGVLQRADAEPGEQRPPAAGRPRARGVPSGTREPADRRAAPGPGRATISGSRPRKTSRQVACVGDQPGDQRADQRGQDPGRGERAEQPRPQRRLVGLAGDDVERDGDDAAADAPARARAATNSAMCPATPAAEEPAGEERRRRPAARRGGRAGRRGRRRATMPTTEATRKALNGQPYQASPSSSRDRGRHRRRDGHRLEGHEGDQHEQAGGRQPVGPVEDPRRAARRHVPPTPARAGASRPGHASSAGPARGPALERYVRGAAALAGGDLLGGLRDDLEQVADHAEVGQLEDRRLGVLVDRDDGLRGLHAGPVLDRAGDAERDVELRRDRLAGLPDLELVRVEAGVDGRPGGADGARRAGRPAPRPA